MPMPRVRSSLLPRHRRGLQGNLLPAIGHPLASHFVKAEPGVEPLRSRIRRIDVELAGDETRCSSFNVDVGNAAELEGVLGEVVAAHGRIDGVIHCAGLLHGAARAVRSGA